MSKSKILFVHLTIYVALAWSWLLILHFDIYGHPLTKQVFLETAHPSYWLIRDCFFVCVFGYYSYDFKKRGSSILWKQCLLFALWILLGTMTWFRVLKFPYLIIVTSIIFYATKNLIAFLRQGENIRLHQ